MTWLAPEIFDLGIGDDQSRIGGYDGRYLHVAACTSIRAGDEAGASTADVDPVAAAALTEG